MSFNQRIYALCRPCVGRVAPNVDCEAYYDRVVWMLSVQRHELYMKSATSHRCSDEHYHSPLPQTPGVDSCCAEVVELWGALAAANTNRSSCCR